MRAGIGTTSLGSVAAVAAAMALAPTAAAQDSGSVSDYRLPEPKQTSRPTVQGPVDPDNPLGVPARTPAPAPAPTITLPAPEVEATPRAAPSPRATPTPRSAPPLPATESSPAPGAAPAAATPDATAPAIAEPEPTSTGPAEDIAAPRNLPAAQEDNGWLVPGLLGAALVGIGAIAFLRRRRSRANTAEDTIVPVAPPPEPRPSAPTPIPPTATPQPVPAPPRPEPAPAAAPLSAEPLAVATAFTAKTVRLSLVYATLQYELEIANAGPEPLPPLQVRADLASAHGSIGTHEQLAPAPDALELQQSVAALTPGETAMLKGEVRVPLQQIVPVAKGNARFLVPLVRFCMLAPDGKAVRRVFTAGPHDPGSNAIASIRLDAGPRNLRDLSAREIEAARSFALDPVGAQG
jgi:hypothetical protein